MAETPNERMQEAADLAAAARDRGMEHLEDAKGQLAEGAERVAAAVERTAGELEGDGDDAISGFGRSVASLMRQLAGGLRERDVEAFAHELGALARRNPGVFLAGSVALGFGIARFFKARGTESRSSYAQDWRSEGGWQGGGQRFRGERDGVDSEEDLDLSTGPTERDDGSGDERSRTQESGNAQPSGGAAQPGDSLYGDTAAYGNTAAQPSLTGDEQRNQGKSRQSSKQKGKAQRASSGSAQSAGEEASPPSSERPSTDTPSGETTGTSDSAFTGGKGRGGKS